LRLLRLPAEIQMGIKDKKIDMGHARAILGLNDPAVQLHLYEAIIQSDFTVRKVEELVRLYLETGSLDAKPKSGANPVTNLQEFDDLQTQLSNVFGTKVQFNCNSDGKGKISIPFTSDEELARIMELFDKI
jgi:ParB family transcriptional regulator, chromosome partitioning protein